MTENRSIGVAVGERASERTHPLNGPPLLASLFFVSVSAKSSIASTLLKMPPVDVSSFHRDQYRSLDVAVGLAGVLPSICSGLLGDRLTFRLDFLEPRLELREHP